jgi:hypothetical protein
MLAQLFPLTGGHEVEQKVSIVTFVFQPLLLCLNILKFTFLISAYAIEKTMELTKFINGVPKFNLDLENIPVSRF